MLLFRSVWDKGTVGHLGVAHRRPIQDPIELSPERHGGPIGGADGIGQGVVDVLVVHGTS